MPNGGTITITAKETRIDESYARMNIDAEPGHYVMISVVDNGAGMTREVQKRIFDPFYTTKEIGKGTGLGLSTTITIVKSHGGFMNVYSEPGKGARFSVYFPARATESLEDVTAEGRQIPGGNGELVLVVDDEQNIREITSATLEKFGYKVAAAADGTEALAVFARQFREIDAVITDIAMPYMDGPATIRAMRRIDPNVKVIAMSGLLSDEQASELEQLGVEQVINKPFTAETLLNTISSIAKRSGEDRANDHEQKPEDHK